MNDFHPEWLTTSQLVAYPEAMAKMDARVEAIVAHAAPELIWLLEHPPLYTAGTSAQAVDLKDAARFPVYAAGRGGQYTYHGPGQRVIYAMLDLRERGRDLRRHVWNLEEWMIRTLAAFGVQGERREGRVGIWVTTPGGAVTVAGSPQGEAQSSRALNMSEKKIGAIGVRVRKWVAYHGLALNIDPDLSHFSGIVPCGLPQFGVTSLRDLGIQATMMDVDAAFKQQSGILIS